VNAAADATGEAETSIRNKLKNQHLGYEILDKVDHGYTPVIIEGVEYESINAVVEANLATNRFQAMRRLNSQNAKWRNWNYKYGKKTKWE